MNEKKSGARSALDAGNYDVVSAPTYWSETRVAYIDPYDMPRPAPAPKETEGKKADEGKVRLDLIPPSMIFGVGRVLTFGAQKYSDRNWEKGIAWSRVYAAALRHLVLWWDGEDNDDETGLSHLEHALCCLAFLCEFLRTHRELDDRPETMARHGRTAS